MLCQLFEDIKLNVFQNEEEEYFNLNCSVEKCKNLKFVMRHSRVLEQIGEAEYLTSVLMVCCKSIKAADVGVLPV